MTSCTASTSGNPKVTCGETRVVYKYRKSASKVATTTGGSTQTVCTSGVAVQLAEKGSCKTYSYSCPSEITYMVGVTSYRCTNIQLQGTKCVTQFQGNTSGTQCPGDYSFDATKGSCTDWNYSCPDAAWSQQDNYTCPLELVGNQCFVKSKTVTTPGTTTYVCPSGYAVDEGGSKCYTYWWPSNTTFTEKYGNNVTDINTWCGTGGSGSTDTCVWRTEYKKTTTTTTTTYGNWGSWTTTKCTASSTVDCDTPKTQYRSNTKPTISTVAVKDRRSSNYKGGEKIQIVFTFSEAIKGTAPTLKLKVGNSDAKGTISAGVVSGKTITHTYTISTEDQGQLKIASYTGGAVTEDSTDKPQSAVLTLPTTFNPITISNVVDKTVPNIKSITIPLQKKESYKAKESFQIVVTFTENVTGTAPTIKLKVGGRDTKGTVGPGVVSGSTVTYIYTVSEEDQGTLEIADLTGGTLKDTDGNDANLSLPATYDQIKIDNNLELPDEGTKRTSSGTTGDSKKETGTTKNVETGIKVSYLIPILVAVAIATGSILLMKRNKRINNEI